MIEHANIDRTSSPATRKCIDYGFFIAVHEPAHRDAAILGYLTKGDVLVLHPGEQVHALLGVKLDQAGVVIEAADGSELRRGPHGSAWAEERRQETALSPSWDTVALPFSGIGITTA